MPTTSSVSTAAIRAKCSSGTYSPAMGYRSINTSAAGICRLSIRRRLRIIPSIDPNSLTASGLVAGGRNRRHRQPISRRAAAPPARLRERGRPQRRPVPRAASRRPAAGLASLPRRWRIRPQLARTARLPEALCSKRRTRRCKPCDEGSAPRHGFAITRRVEAALISRLAQHSEASRTQREPGAAPQPTEQT